MLRNAHVYLLLLLSVGALAPMQLRAQQDVAAEEAALAKQCVKVLKKFAIQAKSKKVGQRAKQAFDLILEYEPDNSQARRELGFRKAAGTWVALPPEKRKKWRDKATYENRFKINYEWGTTATKLSEQHGKLGIKLKEGGNADRAEFHLRKAVYYNPLNEAANLALGHKKGEGFYGTDEQLAFAKRMKQIEVKAVELARKEYPVEELGDDKMPTELRNLIDNAPEWMLKPRFDLHGAKSARFTVWARGSQENVNRAVQWAERAVDFGVWIMGEKAAKELRFVERATRSWAWQGFLATSREREEFLKANPQVLGGRSPEEGMRFANNSWRSQGGPASMKVGGSPKHIQDSLIAYVMMDGLMIQRNDGIGQGIIHAVTWYMKATSISRWGAIPEGTVGDDGLDLPEGTNWWMRTVRDQAVSTQDWWLAQVPREKLSRFRNDCRLKTWSVMTWMMAAYPDKWLPFFLQLPDADKKVPTLEDVEAVVTKVFDKSSEQIDKEWREWARGDSGVAYGTGYGPPLLPERPSKIELTALEQINKVRAQPVAFVWDESPRKDGRWVPLTECEMDAETSLACELHAKYVTNHPELIEDPELGIHEENPAHEDFTRQGQQAGGGNIVTWSGRATEAFARDSIDGWISAIYHRFPMLAHNIKRLGYSHVDENDWSVSVLDMGSLEEPYDPKKAPRMVVWPHHNMQKVPTSFGSPEWPNPLEDQPEGEQDVTKCGYVVSVQFQQELSRQIGECEIHIFEARKGGRQPATNVAFPNSKEFRAWADRCKDEIECYVHTPSVPLNRKRDVRDAVFALPKKPFKGGKTYQARVKLNLGADSFWFIWEFTCGRQRSGLKLK